MDILFLLVPLSVALAFAIGAAFWMAVDGGQFDDLDGPALQVVADDDSVAEKDSALTREPLRPGEPACPRRH